MPGDINVYKVSSEYPDLPPPKLTSNPKQVLQKPFNSATIDPNFNFSPFLMDDSDCCLFAITIPAGAHVLYVPGVYHAYPFEQEILLPPNVTFDIYEHGLEIVHYIPIYQVKLLKAQRHPFKIGEIYEIDQSAPAEIKSKDMNIFFTNLIT